MYRVAADGTATTVFDPEDKYIWALAVDREGDLYVGTGEKGIIYKVGADGKAVLFYNTKSTHVMSMAIDQAGRLLAGTESPGRVLRFDADGRAFVLLDAPLREIHAVRVGANGTVYAAAVGARPSQEERPSEGPPGGPPRPVPVPSVSTEITSISIVDVSVVPTAPAPPQPREERRGARGAVYRILADGAWDVVWDSRDDVPYDVGIDRSGAILVATGSKGKIYQVSGDPPRATLLARAAAQQVTAFVQDPGGPTYYVTANPGKLFRLSAARATQGAYESEVKDARTIATWGTLSWQASTPGDSRVHLLTRSGNTNAPDDTWSPWSQPYRNPDGEAITSPKARYLQWKAVLSGKTDTPVLTSVTAAYLPRNQRPVVTSITVHPPGLVFQKPFSTGELEIAGYDPRGADGRLTPAALAPGPTTPQSPGAPQLGRRLYQKGLQTFVWKAEDEDEDELQYEVLYRREGDTTWRTLKRAVSESIFVWDTTSVPDGTYLVKVAASDASSNPRSAALAGELESTPVNVDNTPPAVSIRGVRRDRSQMVIAFDVRDAQSRLERVEFSLDADRWRAIYPKDGITDSKSEQFELTLDDATPARNVIVRAVDAMNNMASASTDLDRSRN